LAGITTVPSPAVLKASIRARMSCESAIFLVSSSAAKAFSAGPYQVRKTSSQCSGER
jgi:hypothetical protein